MAPGCKPLAIHISEGFLEKGRSALDEETDTRLAQDAFPAQLESLKALLANAPNNKKLLRLTSQAFAGYAFLFLDDVQPARAKEIYERASQYAARSLALNHRLKNLLGAKTLPEFQAVLRKARRGDVPDLFWYGFGQAGRIRLSGDSPDALADLPKIVLLMKRVRKLDESYYFAGADVVLGVYYASKPRMLGGNPAEAKDHFERAEELTHHAFLMTPVLEARYYATTVQDRALYKRLLSQVLEAKPGVLPHAGLADQVAKEKAQAMLKKINDYF
jgi:hypothetical protein